MKIMNCPLNGPRNITEFTSQGEVEPMPDPDAADDAAWADRVWFANNEAGVVREWWCHTATAYWFIAERNTVTAYWFIAERNTVTDEILRSYTADQVFGERVDFAPKQETEPESGKDGR